MTRPGHPFLFEVKKLNVKVPASISAMSRPLKWLISICQRALQWT